MTMTPGTTDPQHASTDGVVATPVDDDIPEWLAALRPAPAPAVPEMTAAPASPPAAARGQVATPGRSSEATPALLAEDDLPAWLTRLATDSPPPPPAPAPPPAGSIPAWVAPAATTPLPADAVAPTAAPAVWGARETTAAPTAETGAAIFAALASTPPTVAPEEPATVASSSPPATRAIPWWWFAAAAAVIVLIVALALLLR